MAAEVSSFMRGVNCRMEDEITSSDDVLITKDFLGGRLALNHQSHNDDDEPSPLFVKPDENSFRQQQHPCSSGLKQFGNRHQIQDLNFPPLPSLSSILEDPLDLKLVPSNEYQSVCTLEKVKSALERAERVSSSRKRRRSCEDLASSSSSEKIELEMTSDQTSEKMFASGCPGCLLYVLISHRNPRCPRCNSIVPYPTLKKSKHELNGYL